MVADLGEEVCGDGFVVLEVEAAERVVEQVDEALRREDFVVDFLRERGVPRGAWLLPWGSPRASCGA